jgi:hypothetical protein
MSEMRQMMAKLIQTSAEQLLPQNGSETNCSSRQATGTRIQSVLASRSKANAKQYHRKQLLTAGVMDSRKKSHIDIGTPYGQQDNRKSSAFGVDNPLQQRKGKIGLSNVDTTCTSPTNSSTASINRGKISPKSPSGSLSPKSPNLIARRRLSRKI